MYIHTYVYTYVYTYIYIYIYHIRPNRHPGRSRKFALYHYCQKIRLNECPAALISTSTIQKFSNILQEAPSIQIHT